MLLLRLFAFFILFSFLPAFSKILYEFRADSTTLDPELDWVFDGTSIVKAPFMDSSNVIKINLKPLEKSHKPTSVQKQFPVLPVMSFRFNFAYDTIGIFDTLAWARHVEWAKAETTWSFAMMRFIVDDQQETPYQQSLLSYSLAYDKPDWRIRYVVNSTRGGGILKMEKGSIVLPGRAYCFSYRVRLDQDSMVQDIEFRVNGRTDLSVVLGSDSIKVKNQLLSIGLYNLKYNAKGSFYFDNLAYGTDWMGNPPAKPRIRADRSLASVYYPLRVVLYAPPFRTRLVTSPHAATQYQVHFADGDWSLPLYDSGPGSGKAESLMVRIRLDTTRRYAWRVRHFDTRGNSSDWSAPLPLPYLPDTTFARLSAFPHLYGVYFTAAGKSKPLRQLLPDTWYDLVVKASDPKGVNNIGYGVFWRNNMDYTLGSTSNRGGKYFPQSSYAYNFSIGPNKIFEKITVGKYKFKRLVDTKGLYLDASQNLFRINGKDSTFRLRVRLLKEARPGKWSLRGYVKNSAEQASQFFYDTFEMVPEGTSASGTRRASVFYASAVLFFCAVGLAVFLVIRRGRSKAAVPSRDQETFNTFDEFVRGNLEKELSIREIEAHMSMGYSNLYRIVKSASKKSIKNYIIGLKIDRAKRLLKTTNLNVTEVMQAVGFNNSAHFSTAFKKYSGKSPRQFREESR
jgi:AraC-like DNA-binding protein